MKNLQYKDKYLKYKNKYYKIKKNIKGGNIEVYTIIALILGIIGSGIYLYKNNTDNKLDLDNKLETYSSITNKLNIDIQNYFNILNELINNKNSLDLYKKLYNFFKYEHIDIHNFYKIDKEKIDESFNELIILFSKLKNETPVLTLINLEKDNLLKDSFIYSFKSSIIENVSFDESIRRDIEKMSYIEIRNELINYIEQQKLYDVYFVENLNINKSNTDKNDISLAELKEKANEKNTQDNKKRFIEFMKLNNNIVSDFPMIHAASDKYNIYIVLLVNFKNTRYFKLYKPINIKEPASIKNTIVLNYSNYCDFNCDFMNNENIHAIIKNINTNAISINSELLKSNNNNNNISNLYNINKDNLNMNFEWADKDDNKFLKITEINFFNNKYNNTNSNINNISQQTNLSYNEKNEINKELNIRPWYQYYKFNYNMKPY